MEILEGVKDMGELREIKRSINKEESIREIGKILRD